MKDHRFTAKNGKDYVIRKITSKDISGADRHYSKEFASAIKDGCLTRKALNKLMQEQGTWTKEHETKYFDTLSSISKMEYALNSGKDESGKLTKNKAKEIAITLHKTREELRGLIAERTSQDTVTAEGLADQAKFNYLVVQCVIDYETNKPVFSSLDDYMTNGDDELSLEIAGEFAKLYYGVKENYEKDLTEYKFLRRFNYIDDNGRFIDPEGKHVTEDGHPVDDEGYLLNDEGKRVNADNLPIDDVVGVENVEFIDD